jgi:hypothetical protein
MNLLYYAGPVLSTYQSFRLPYFTPLLPNNAIILASNLIPARMAELGGADSAHLHSSRAGIDVSAPSLPHPTTGTSNYSVLLLTVQYSYIKVATAVVLPTHAHS